MTLPLFQKTKLQEGFAALRRDLIQEDGPRISTMRNYRFAIVQYDPADEFMLRQRSTTVEFRADSQWLDGHITQPARNCSLNTSAARVMAGPDASWRWNDGWRAIVWTTALVT